MPKFIDKNSHSWVVELTIGIARKVFDVSKTEQLSALIDDPYQRFDLLWVIARSKLKNARLTKFAFDNFG